ncbi:MAG TPA: pyridoxal-phosphate dependent enzyme [Jiangellaceae bacterium]
MLAASPALARFPLVAAPTPLQRAYRLEAALGGPPLYLKRDDLTGLARAGNKARKLELLVGDALERGADVILTGGGPASNHCYATAVAASVAGLGCVLLYYGSPPKDEPPNLAFARDVEADVRFTGDLRRESVEDGLETLAQQLRTAGRRPYVIPRGGATPVGSAAYGLAVGELAAQLKDAGVAPTTVVVATGSCGTQAGLVAGTVAGGYPWHVVGASVSRPQDESSERVLRLARGAAALCGWPEPTAADVDVRDARGPGYGVPSADGQAAALLSVRREGLLLDPVFTAKAMALVIRLAAGDTDGPILFWHTGGVPTPLGGHNAGRQNAAT